MAIKFGTDGMRGIAYEELTEDIAFSVGNALGRIVENCRVLLGRDTRESGENLSAALIRGLVAAGGSAIDCALMPTAGVAYLVRKHKLDFGVVISASHNPAEYNGIKVFDADGYKVSDLIERQIETLIAQEPYYTDGGAATDYSAGEREYIDFLVQKGCDLTGMNILLDCSNGASARIAPEVFKRLGANVTALNVKQDGKDINRDCGAVNAELLSEKAMNYDVTFAFDGDSDRLIALDENGDIVDGDKNLLIIGKYLLSNGALTGNIIAGTTMTNMGIQKAAEDCGATFVRADVGDKYVLRELLERGGILGGEGSGHTLILSESTTGDGIQTAVILSKIIRQSESKLSELAKFDLYPQIIKSIAVKDKEMIVGELTQKVREIEAELGGDGRVILRPSGTEQKVRIMIECKDFSIAEKYVNYLTNIINDMEI